MDLVIDGEPVGARDGDDGDDGEGPYGGGAA